VHYVRWLVFLCLTSFGFKTALAQQQERSLIDRLLRPNMELQNTAQGKVFTANSKVVAGHGTARTFVVEPVATERTFGDTRAAVTKEYRSHLVQADALQTPVVETRQVNVPAPLTTSSARDLHAAYDAHLSVSGRTFPDQRTFRDQGKSQKLLNRQNPPLTIDQVRELLNKNK
jgi:hypothetical protein